MEIVVANILVEKSKTKKDGVYSFREYKYVVKNNLFVFFADYSGNVYERCGNFNVKIGKVERYNLKKELLKLLK